MDASWVRQTAILVGIYLGVMTLVVLFVPGWRDLDWRLYQRVGPHAHRLSTNVRLVEIDSWNADTCAANYRSVAAFVRHLASSSNALPKALIVDINFDPPSSCGPIATEISAIADSYETARRANVRVYGVEKIDASDEGGEGAKIVERHDEAFYRNLSAAGHTSFQPAPGRSEFVYRACFADVPADASGVVRRDIWSVVWLAVQGTDLGPCVADPVAVELPDAAVPTDRIAAAMRANYAGAYVVLGLPRGFDALDGGRRGSELLAWALSDALLDAAASSQPLPARERYLATHPELAQQGRALLLLVPVFSVFVAIAFTAAFFLLDRLRLRSLLAVRVPVAVAIATVVGFGAFALFEYWMYEQGRLQPQVTLVCVGMAVAAALCGVRGRQAEWERINAIDFSPGKDERYGYDVFISYAHDDTAWVLEHVLGPMRSARIRKKDGTSRPIDVFFDSASIRVGVGWWLKICMSIDKSRFVVPVFTPTYFTRNYCNYEIERAHKKYVNSGGARCVLPITFGRPTIPDLVRDFQGPDVEDHPDLIKETIALIVATLSRDVADDRPTESS